MEIQVEARPIIFSGAMVRALLAGTKTQTRRIIKVQPDNEYYRISTLISTTGDRRNEGRHFWGRYSAIGNSLLSRSKGYFSCPYGQPGDRLWVRETYRFKTFCGSVGMMGNRADWHYQPSDKQLNNPGDWEYRADVKESQAQFTGAWKASIFMPRAASRILLEIASVRCERLQDISEADAYAEGCERQMCARCDESGQELEGEYKSQPCSDCAGEGHFSLAEAYRRVWASINGPGSWAANPWVWVVEFKRVEA